jgi:nucleoside-triphosphatase
MREQHAGAAACGWGGKTRTTATPASSTVVDMTARDHAAPEMPAKLLLRGRPKIGKTTVVERFVELLRNCGIPVGGFLTRELRENDRRVGFAVRDLDGSEEVIAHQNFATGVRVGRFGVDVATFERVALPALCRALDSDAVLVIDEIARMELASTGFTVMLGKIMERAAPVVATVHVHEHPVTDALLSRADVTVIEVTEGNRDELPAHLFARLPTV